MHHHQKCCFLNCELKWFNRSNQFSGVVTYVKKKKEVEKSYIFGVILWRFCYIGVSVMDYNMKLVVLKNCHYSKIF